MITNGKTTTNHIIRSPLRPKSAPKPYPTSFFSPFTSTGSIKIHISLCVFFSPFLFDCKCCFFFFSISINNVEFNFQFSMTAYYHMKICKLALIYCIVDIIIM